MTSNETTAGALLPPLSCYASLVPYYDAGGITIYHGDSRKILPMLGRFDLLMTDPPYGIGFAAQPTTGGRKRGQKKEQWDDEAIEEWVLHQAMARADKRVIWGGNYYNLPAARFILSWYKPDAPPSMGNVEYAWTNLDQNSRQISRSIAATNPERLGHPTGGRGSNDPRSVRGLRDNGPRRQELRQAVRDDRAGGTILRNRRPPPRARGAAILFA